MVTVLYKQQECILTGRIAIPYVDGKSRRQDTDIRYFEIKLKDDDGVETTEWVLAKDLLLIEEITDYDLLETTSPNLKIT